MSAIWAGNIVQLTFVLGLSVAWVASYVARHEQGHDLRQAAQGRGRGDGQAPGGAPEAELEKMIGDISKLDPK